MTDYKKLNQIFERIITEAEERFSLDPSTISKTLMGKNRGMSSADVESRNIFINTFIGQAIQSLESAISSGLVDPAVRQGSTDEDGKKSISQFIKEWFDSYMRGSRVNSSMAPQNVDQIVNLIQNAYQSEAKGSLWRKEGAGKKTQQEISRLGHLGWALYHLKQSEQPTRMPSGRGPTLKMPGETPFGSERQNLNQQYDISELSNAIKNAASMINKFDATTKRKAISVILQQTNMVANANQIIDAIEADKVSRADIVEILKAAQRKLGPEVNPNQPDLLQPVTSPTAPAKQTPNNVVQLKRKSKSSPTGT